MNLFCTYSYSNEVKIIINDVLCMAKCKRKKNNGHQNGKCTAVIRGFVFMDPFRVRPTDLKRNRNSLRKL